MTPRGAARRAGRLPDPDPAARLVAGHPPRVQGGSADNVGILAGGVAYFAFLAIFPALIAGISLYGLVADPATIAQQAAGVPRRCPRRPSR